MDKFKLNPLSSETHSYWLIIYILFINLFAFISNEYIMSLIFIIFLVPRIQQSIHILTHDKLSLITKYCNHRNILNIILCNILSFSFESLLSCDVYVQKYIHNTHHLCPVVENKDLSYKYTKAPYKSLQGYFQCFFQPEIEFIETLDKIYYKPIMIGLVYRLFMFLLLFNFTSYINFVLVITLSRITRMMFYFNAFHIQHMTVNNEINPFGVNIIPSKFDIIYSIIFGKLSVEENYGHVIHHKNSQIKPREYLEIIEKTNS
jgi:hypothetical protein